MLDARGAFAVRPFGTAPKTPPPTTVEPGRYECTLAIDGVWQRPYSCEVKSFYQDGAYHEAKALRPDEDYGAGFKADLAYRDGAWIGELDFSRELEFGGMNTPPTQRITLRMTRR